jgi:predicted dehydrogenase
MIEKPLAQDTPSSARLADAFEEAGLVGAVGHIERFNPALQNLRQRLENGDLGSVFQVVTRRQGPFPARIADVGVVKDLATHDIDLTAWVTQQTYASVSARTAFKSGRQHEDLVAVVGQLRDGTVTSHLVNWLSPMKERVTIVTGERGAFVADTLSADLTFFANGLIPTTWDEIATFRGVAEGDMIRFAFAKPEPLRTEHETFRDAVLGKSMDIVTMREGLATVAVAEAVLQASSTGKTVDLPEA